MLARTFWLVECVARQGRLDEAGETFDRAIETSSGLGLFAEEFDSASGRMLGNLPKL